MGRRRPSSVGLGKQRFISSIPDTRIERRHGDEVIRGPVKEGEFAVHVSEGRDENRASLTQAKNVTKTGGKLAVSNKNGRSGM